MHRAGAGRTQAPRRLPHHAVLPALQAINFATVGEQALLPLAIVGVLCMGITLATVILWHVFTARLQRKFARELGFCLAQQGFVSSSEGGSPHAWAVQQRAHEPSFMRTVPL